MIEQHQQATRQIARAASVVMAAFAVSNIMGLIRQILVSQAFGTSAELDAFNAASTYPDLIFSLVAGGALASAFVPTLTGFLARENNKGGWYLSSAITNLVFCILSVICIFSFFLAPQIVDTILPSTYAPELQALVASLLRIMLLAPIIFGVSGILMGILNAHQSFLWPALAPSMLWLGMIIGVIFFSPSMGIFGLAWGYVLGSFLHFIIQLPAVIRLPNWQYFLTFGLRFPAVREVGRLMGPRLLGVAAVQINFVINTILATSMNVGSLASIKYAWAIMTMPQVIIAQSIAIAALPTFSAQVARSDLNNMRSSLASTLRGVILLSLPATVGLVVLRQPIIMFLFQRGAFSQESTELVAWALLWYTIGLVGHGIVEILSRAFYAMHDTKTPVFVGIGAMSLNLGFSFAFTFLFTQIGWWPHGGLALANTFATSLEAICLWTIMRGRLSGIEGHSILLSTLKAGASVLIMGLGLFAWLQVSIDFPSWVVVIGGMIIGVLVYGICLFVLRVQEIELLVAFSRRRFHSRMQGGK